MEYTNSALVSYKKLSPHHSGIRVYPITRITIHHVVGQLSVEALGAEFSGSRSASSNYGIGSDGRVGLYVPESCRAWTSASYDNDQRAVNIETADDAFPPYKVNETAYAKLLELCADICRRNGKSKLLWLGDKEKTLNYEPKDDEMVLTVHRWLAPTACPGEWLMQHMGEIAERVTEDLAKSNYIPEPQQKTYPVELPVLRRGDKNGYVKTMQTLLIAQKYSCGGYGADGSFGPSTATAVNSYQRNHGLTVDEKCGPQMWTELLKF